MKHKISAVLLLFSCTLFAEQNTLFTFPGDKFGKGPGLTLKGKTLEFAPVSRMYINKKFDPAGGSFELTAKFAPVPSNDKKNHLHYLWSARGNKRTIASGVITENAGTYQLSFYVFDTDKKPVSCACKVKLPAEKSTKLSFIWTKENISIKVNGILFAKKTFKGTLQTGESFMIGTAQPNRTLIPMTLEKVVLADK
jgi:hypothetical protein